LRSRALRCSSLRLRPAAARVFVQKRDREIGAGGSVSVAFTRANQPGNVIVVFVVWDNPGRCS